MKKVFSTFFLLLIVSLFKPVYAQFPLEVGNRWDYVEGWWDGSGNSDSDTVVYRVVSDTLLPNGKVYYKVIPTNNDFFRGLMRSDSSGIYFFDSVCDREWLFYDYTLPVGEYIEVPTFNCDTTDGARVYKTFNGTTVLFGENVYTMKFDYEGGIDIFYLIDVSPEFGFTRWSSGAIFTNYYKYLLGAQLSGVVYGILTNIDDENPMPYKYLLHQNYPNPFNPSTIIEYEIPEVSFVTVKVYDVLGNEIRTLVNQENSVGIHKVEFNAEGLSSGVYFYKLETSNYSETNKMLLMR